MRIRMNDAREARFDELMMASPEKTKSKAIDRAVEFYVEMVGAYGAGTFEQLLDAAEADGSLTAAEIAEMLNSKYYPIRYEVVREMGEEQ